MPDSYPAIQEAAVSAYTIPTDKPEADGTIEWDDTTLVLVDLKCGETTAFGYSYADSSAAFLIAHKLADQIIGQDPMAVPATVLKLERSVRNSGRPGIASTADRRDRSRALGLESQTARCAARDAAGRLPPAGDRLWQRRIHVLFNRHVERTVGELVGGRLFGGKNEDRHASGSGSETRQGSSSRNREHLRIVCRRQWRLHAKAGDRNGGDLRRPGRHMV